ncbi:MULTISPECIES: hypothetical protein [Streptomyces]|uniref:hypothetical protein n=1 Tax=Streptomyces TaxID=1883 RepID=UPI00345BE7C7
MTAARLGCDVLAHAKTRHGRHRMDELVALRSLFARANRPGHHPAARLVLALAAVHAARVARIATLMLDDADIGNGRPTIAGRVRPVGDPTLKLLLAAC